ncbi:hypothetical protein O181_019228 [Austropuccinia psidii MF-1]|uniref:Major facilitator superfamily (MFS) profile domain-containing protein n=1 Tax=Austropuccinia psidii MF-1 TaxID=1389203 RepID=A0A9Q3GTE3_9BASI|nr:hypothetical protein [Austropuccinia psidii MF-1]
MSMTPVGLRSSPSHRLEPRFQESETGQAIGTKKQSFELVYLKGSSVKSTQDNTPKADNALEVGSIAQDFALPSTDRGFSAWLFLIISFLVEGFVWAPPMSFGVFLNFHPYLDMKPTLAALIGTSSMGALYCSGSLLMYSIERHPKLALWYPTIGTLLCTASFVAASYSTKTWQYLLTQGFMFAMGGALLYYPALFLLAEWWIIKRGFAVGFMFAGTSVFGLIIPLVLDWTLQKYGTSVTLRILGVAFSVGLLPFLPFFRGRLPVSLRRRKTPTKAHIHMKRPVFWAFMALNFLQSLAFFIPTLYLPSYATSIGCPGGVILALLAGASIIGQFAMGVLSDHFDLYIIIGINLVASTISTFFLWGLSRGFYVLATFAVIYGLSAGGFSSLWLRFAMTLAPSEPNPGSLVVYFSMSRGFANILTGPIAGAMLKGSGSARSNYTILVYFSGSLMLFCTIGTALAMVLEKKRKN